MWVNYPHMPTGTKATDALFESLIAFRKEARYFIDKRQSLQFLF